jgi:iron complex outermembrane receptor protein
MLMGRSLYLDTAAFHNEHHGLASVGLGTATVELTPRPHGRIRLPFVNGIDGTSNGFEIAPDWRPVSALQVSGSYAFRTFDMQQRPVSVDPNAVARYEGVSPRHQASLHVRTAPAARLELDGAYRYVGSLQALRVEAYHSVDLRVGWRLNRTTSVSIAGQNLLQPHHREFVHEPGPSVGIERGVWAGLTWAADSR